MRSGGCGAVHTREVGAACSHALPPTPGPHCLTAFSLPAGESVSTATGAVVAMVESSGSDCDPNDLNCMRATIQTAVYNDVQVG